MMTDHLPNTIELYGHILNRPGGGTYIVADSYIGDQGRLEVRLTLKDDVGKRTIRCHEGDTFEFASTFWKVTKIFGEYMDGRRHIATISRVE